RLDDAHHGLTKILAGSPNDVAVLNALAITTDDLGDKYTAIQLYRKVLRITPDYTKSAAWLRRLEDTRRRSAQMVPPASHPYAGGKRTAEETQGPVEAILAYRLADGEPASPGTERHHMRRSLGTFLPTFLLAGLLFALAPTITAVMKSSTEL